MKELPKRKPNRLKNHDYSKSKSYFITICSKERACIFSTISDRTAGEHSSPLQGQICLTEIGLIIENELTILSNSYMNIHVADFVIMPNHLHMIIIIKNNARLGIHSDQTAQCRGELCSPAIRPREKNLPDPTISRIIKQWKGSITKKIGFSPWQKSFHDHIIRNEDDYIRIADYIADNPSKWKEDCFFTDV
jgi:REP element-mobilizing transposase RayT